MPIRGWQDSFIQLYSFSKSFCIPGHRLGAIVAGAPVVEQIVKIMDNLQICAQRPAQHAVARAIPALAGWRDGNRAEMARRASAFRAALADSRWQIEALGAYFGYVRHPFAGDSAAAVAERLAREFGVVTVPGSYFGSGQEPFLRMAFANADAATIALLGSRLPR